MSSARSCSQLKSGKWRARYTDPSGKERSKHFDTKSAGLRWLDEHRTAIAHGTWVDPKSGQQLFEVYVATWVERQDHVATTVESLERALRLHILPTFGSRRMVSIVRADVQTWLRREGEKLSATTAGTNLRWLKTILKSAVADGVIPRNPADGVSAPRAPKRLIRPLEAAQVMAIADAMPKRYRAAVVLASATGLRQGELLGLTPSGLDFLRRQVRVERQLVTVRGKTDFTPPKTRSSVRVVPVPQHAIDAISQHCGQFGVGPDDLLFTTERGMPVARNRWSELWSAAVRKAGVPKDVGGTRAGSHTLRHFYASTLIAAGCSVPMVQAAMGHASAEETLRTYAHLWPKDDERTRDAIAKAFAAVIATDDAEVDAAVQLA